MAAHHQEQGAHGASPEASWQLNAAATNPPLASRADVGAHDGRDAERSHHDANDGRAGGRGAAHGHGRKQLKVHLLPNRENRRKRDTSAAASVRRPPDMRDTSTGPAGGAPARRWTCGGRDAQDTNGGRLRGDHVAASAAEVARTLPASRPAAVDAGKLDFPARSRCPRPHATDGSPPEALPPEVLDVIAVAVEIAIQRHRAGNAA